MRATETHLRRPSVPGRAIRGRGSRGLVPGCPGAAPLHDHALLPWRFHALLRAADGIL